MKRIEMVMLVVLMVACGGSGEAGGPGKGGVVTVDGSSTVYPITEAMAEEFGISTSGAVNVTIAYSGTGGGFKRFCAGETDISNASRHISQAERDTCAAAGIEWLEIPVATDGLTVVVNPANTFVQCLTVAELRSVWEPGSSVDRWSQVRAGWPDEEMKLYGPGTNSGTFDYFTEAIMGEAGAIRDDYTASEDDNVLVQGVEGDGTALGFFGYAYYAENTSRLRSVAVDGGAGCIQPTPVTVRDGTYAPLSRPLFIYVKRTALARPAVNDFVRFYLENAEILVPEVGYIPLPAEEYQAQLSALPAAG
jgi:phosphate transport system substrate-binding protein